MLLAGEAPQAIRRSGSTTRNAVSSQVVRLRVLQPIPTWIRQACTVRRFVEPIRLASRGSAPTDGVGPWAVQCLRVTQRHAAASPSAKQEPPSLRAPMPAHRSKGSAPPPIPSLCAQPCRAPQTTAPVFNGRGSSRGCQRSVTPSSALPTGGGARTRTGIIRAVRRGGVATRPGIAEGRQSRGAAVAGPYAAAPAGARAEWGKEPELASFRDWRFGQVNCFGAGVGYVQRRTICRFKTTAYCG
jgi:hypothetical protein